MFLNVDPPKSYTNHAPHCVGCCTAGDRESFKDLTRSKKEMRTNKEGSKKHCQLTLSSDPPASLTVAMILQSLQHIGFHLLYVGW